jgi:hypothetical protein
MDKNGLKVIDKTQSIHNYSKIYGGVYMPETAGLDVLNFMSTKPEVLLLIALLGALCVVGVVDYLRCFFEKKRNTIRWVVLLLSLLVAIVLSPITPRFVATIIILWLLILALATIGKKALIEGVPMIILMVVNKMTGGILNNNQKDKSIG